jgi:mannosyltransferase
MSTSAVRERASILTSPRAYVLPSLMIVAAAVLRFVHLGTKSLWTDEAVSVAIARLGWSDFRKVITNHEANMGLYYLLLKFWLNLGGSEFAIRSLSAIASVATVWLLYLMGTRWFGRRTGVIAAALLATNAFHIRYAQEARSYALVVLLVTLSTLWFVAAMEEPSRAAWRLYVISSVLAVYAHMFAALVLFAHCAALGLRPRESVPWRDVKRSAVVIILACAPLAWFAIAKNTGQIGWIPKPGLHQIHEFFYDLSGRGEILLTLFAVSAVAGGVAVLRTRPAATDTEENRDYRRGRGPQKARFWLSGVGGRQRYGPASGDKWKYQVVWAWLLVPVLICLLVSLRKPAFYPRYLIIVLPAFVLAAAIGLSRIRPRVLAAVALFAMLALGVRSTFGWYRASFDPLDQHWREATQHIVSSSRSGDALLMFHPYIALNFEYYRGRLGTPDNTPLRMFPLRGDGVILRSLAPIDSSKLRPGQPLMNQIVNEHERVWLILNTGGPIPDQIQAVLSSTHPAVRKWNFGYGVDVYLYSGR